MDLATARRLTRKRQRASRTRDKDAFALGGGLNLIDPPMTIKPGYCIAVENYEIGVNGGYDRLGGFERFDGRPAPSEAKYWVVPVRHHQPFPATIQPGNTLVNFNATVTATIIEAVEFASAGLMMSIFTEHMHLSPWSASAAATLVVVEDVPLPVPPSYAGLFSGGTAVGFGLGSDTRRFAPRAVALLTEIPGDALFGHAAEFNTLLGAVGAWEDLVAGEYVLASIYVRHKDRRYVRFRAADGDGFGGVAPSADFDLVGRAVVAQSASVDNAFLVDAGNGWLRLVIQTVAATDTDTMNDSAGRLFLLNDALEYQYEGDGTSGVYLTGVNASKATGAAPELGPYRANYNNSFGSTPHWAGNGAAYIAILGRTDSFFLNQPRTADLFVTDVNAEEIGLQSGSEVELGAPTIEKHLEYLAAAADARRELITVVPGSGPVRGVWMYKGVVYAFRDNDGATAGRMYRSTAGGWVEVTFDPHLNFDAGLPAGLAGLVEGATVTGATSGASAAILRVNITDPAWGASGAIGTLVLGPITGGPFQNNEALQVSAVNVATADGANYTPTFAAGGHYRFRTHNFYGASNKKRMYGVYGGGRYFEYDDTDEVLASYRTGMPVDTPEWLAIDQNQLMLGFPGGSWQVAGAGFPANWTVLLGAAEIGLGDDITGVLEETAGAVFIFTRGRTFQLTGNPFDGYTLDTYDFENGAIEDSVQRIGFGIHLDDRGFGSLLSSDKHGNYEANTFSGLIQPLVAELLKSATVTASVIHRSGNRYRCFFSDGRFISIGVRGAAGHSHHNAPTRDVAGHMVCDYGKVVRCACSEEDANGIERVFFGSDDGYVYEAEKGTSFDGETVRAGLRLPHHHSGYPDRNKLYRVGRVEGILHGQTTLTVTPDLSFGRKHLRELDISAPVGGAIWDHTMQWEGFHWDTVIEPLKPFKIGAEGINIGLALSHESRLERPHTLRAVVFQTTFRAINRRASVG